MVARVFYSQSSITGLSLKRHGTLGYHVLILTKPSFKRDRQKRFMPYLRETVCCHLKTKKRFLVRKDPPALFN